MIELIAYHKRRSHTIVNLVDCRGWRRIPNAFASPIDGGSPFIVPFRATIASGDSVCPDGKRALAARQRARPSAVDAAAAGDRDSAAAFAHWPSTPFRTRCQWPRA